MSYKSIIVFAVVLIAVVGIGCGKAKNAEMQATTQLETEPARTLPEGAIAFDYANHLYFEL